MLRLLLIVSVFLASFVVFDIVFTEKAFAQKYRSPWRSSTSTRSITRDQFVQRGVMRAERQRVTVQQRTQATARARHTAIVARDRAVQKAQQAGLSATFNTARGPAAAGGPTSTTGAANASRHKAVATPKQTLPAATVARLRSSVSGLPSTAIARTPPKPATIAPPKRPVFIKFRQNAKEVALAAAQAGRLRAAAETSRCSFHGDTLVVTKDGRVPIRDIRVGDLVWSMDDNTGAADWKLVLAKLISDYNYSIRIIVTDRKSNALQTLMSSPLHPFFALTGAATADSGYSNGTWTSAEFLRPGQLILSLDGMWSKIQDIYIENAPLFAYNLSIQDFNTYFVSGDQSASALWVHNDCVFGKFSEHFKNHGLAAGMTPAQYMKSAQDHVLPGKAELSSKFYINGEFRRAFVSKIKGKDLYIFTSANLSLTRIYTHMPEGVTKKYIGNLGINLP